MISCAFALLLSISHHSFLRSRGAALFQHQPLTHPHSSNPLVATRILPHSGLLHDDGRGPGPLRIGLTHCHTHSAAASVIALFSLFQHSCRLKLVTSIQQHSQMDPFDHHVHVCARSISRARARASWSRVRLAMDSLKSQSGCKAKLWIQTNGDGTFDAIACSGMRSARKETGRNGHKSRRQLCCVVSTRALRAMHGRRPILRFISVWFVLSSAKF